MPTATNNDNVLLPISQAAVYVFGKNTSGSRQRLVRLAKTGKLRVVKIGVRGDRWFPKAELDRLLDAEVAR